MEDAGNTAAAAANGAPQAETADPIAQPVPKDDNAQLQQQITLLTTQMQQMMGQMQQLTGQNTAPTTQNTTPQPQQAAAQQDDTEWWQQGAWDSWHSGANWWDSGDTSWRKPYLTHLKYPEFN